MPRFVVLRHEMPAGGERGSHFDLMIEQGAALRTWALDEWPPGGRNVAALSLPDHRLDYLTYEGPVSADRGHVTRVDDGTCEILTSGDAAWSVALQGREQSGRLDLHQTAHDRWIARWSGGKAAGEA